jgi:hypothetical protein
MIFIRLREIESAASEQTVQRASRVPGTPETVDRPMFQLVNVSLV